MRFSRSFVLLWSCLALMFSTSLQSADLSVVKKWMATNSGVSSVKIAFTQKRTMRSLKVPIRQSGTLWMDYGRSRFRWETGNPAQTIVTKKSGDLLIMRTLGKKFERRRFSSGGNNQGMAVMAGGFPRSMSEFTRKYRVLSTEKRSNTFRIATQPLGSAGKGVSQVTFIVKASGYRLVGMDIKLKDGSSIDTAFNRVQLNASVPANLFSPDLTGYKETKF